MIGRDEADRYLPEVLDHLIPLVDKIVFTDDGSLDETYLIAANADASVVRMGNPMFEDDESKLRSIAWQHLGLYARFGDWILSIDCDEKLYNAENLREFLSTTQAQAVMVTFYHMWNHDQYRIDKAWRPDQQARIYRYHPEGTYKQKKLACGSAPMYVDEMIRNHKTADIGLRMQHLGYQSSDDRMLKFDRYMNLDGGKYHSLRHLESITDSHPTLVDWNQHAG